MCCSCDVQTLQDGMTKNYYYGLRSDKSTSSYWRTFWYLHQYNARSVISEKYGTDTSWRTISYPNVRGRPIAHITYSPMTHKRKKMYQCASRLSQTKWYLRTHETEYNVDTVTQACSYASESCVILSVYSEYARWQDIFAASINALNFKPLARSWAA